MILILKILFFKGFGPSCPSDASIIELTPDLKNIIVELHNKYRNQQALGQTPNYEPAVRMATIKWDPELARLAEMNVRTCMFGHDNCMNTGKMQNYVYLSILNVSHFAMNR